MLGKIGFGSCCRRWRINESREGPTAFRGIPENFVCEKQTICSKLKLEHCRTLQTLVDMEESLVSRRSRRSTAGNRYFNTSILILPANKS
jgi:hypothetical protein